MLHFSHNRSIGLLIYLGAHTECQYGLSSFGIPVEFIPMSHQGGMKKTNHLKWIAQREVKDEALKNNGVFDGIDIPGRNDVILRRGRVYHTHPGNARMGTLVELHQEAYKRAPQGEKAKISEGIIETIKKESGGRFLECGKDDWWTEVSLKEAGKRVSKSIRSFRSTKAVERRSLKMTEFANKKRLTEVDGENSPKKESPSATSFDSGE